jgi:hypothetical protein
VIWFLLILWTAGSVAVGWPLARGALPEETRTAVLLALALVGGYALETVVLVMLWGVMPPGSAFYLTVAACSAAGSLLIWRTLRHIAPRPMVWGMGTVDTLLCGGMVVVFAFLAHRFFTVGYSAWDPEALYWHSGVPGWMSRAAFPPTNPLEPDDPLHYRFGNYVLASSMIGDLGTSPPVALAATLFQLMPLMVLAFVGTSLRIFDGARPGLVASTLGLFGGSLLPVWRLAQSTLGVEAPAQHAQEFVAGLLWLGNNLDMLHNNVTIPGGFVAFTVALWLSWEAVGRGNHRWQCIVLASSALAFLGLSNEVHFGALAGGLSLLMAARFLEQRRLSRNSLHQVAILLCMLVVAGAVIFFRGGILGGASWTGASNSSVKLVLNTQHFGQVPAPPGIWEPAFMPFLTADSQIDTDLILFGLPLLLVLAWRAGNGYAVAGLASASVAMAAWLTVYPALSPYDGFRFGQAGFVAYLSMAPFAIASARPHIWLLRQRGSYVAEAILVAALISVHLGLAMWLTESPPPSTISTQGSPDYDAAEWLRLTQTTSRVFVPLVPNDKGLGEIYRLDEFGTAIRTIVGDSAHAVPMGHNAYDNPERYLNRYRQAGTTFDPADLGSLQVDWVYVLPTYLSDEQRTNLEAASTNGVLELEKSFGKAGSSNERLLFRVTGRSGSAGG